LPAEVTVGLLAGCRAVVSGMTGGDRVAAAAGSGPARAPVGWQHAV